MPDVPVQPILHSSNCCFPHTGTRSSNCLLDVQSHSQPQSQQFSSHPPSYRHQGPSFQPGVPIHQHQHTSGYQPFPQGARAGPQQDLHFYQNPNLVTPPYSPQLQQGYYEAVHGNHHTVQPSHQQRSPYSSPITYEILTDANGRQVLVKSASIVGPAQLQQAQVSDVSQAQLQVQPESYQQHQYQPSPHQFQPGHQGIPRTVETTCYDDRIKGISKLHDAGGASKNLKLIDFARKCPTKWAKESKQGNINLALYGYAAMAELESLLCSEADDLQRGEHLARVRHVKNVFEVCCANSEARDFSSYGWVLARDYAFKVENKVEQGFSSWGSMPQGVQTADLVMAQCEYPRPQQKLEPKKLEQKTCTTYNTCSTVDKCEYEVANPDKTCQRRHECSYCRKFFKQSYKHQEIKCSKKRDGITGK